MKQLLFFCMFLFIGLTESFAQFVDKPVGPPMSPTDQYVKYFDAKVSIQLDNNGNRYATVTLPFSLNNTVCTGFELSTVLRFEWNDKTIEFTFESPTLRDEKATLYFEDKEPSFGYIDTLSGHAYFAYKWKYIIDIKFDNNK